jgi:uncharacterized protein (DUF305 family)
MNRRILVAAIAVLTAGAAVLPVVMPAAQQRMPQHGDMMGMHSPAMQSAMERMQQGMGMPSSGDPDVDFAQMMIPHHEGAIDMAKSQLENGQDPDLRQLAEEIIEAQEKEIEFLQDWLRRKGQ